MDQVEILIMAFTPDLKTMSRNVYLQRRLSVQCEFLDREKQSFKRRYEDKQKECMALLKSLQSDSKRYGLPVQNFSLRPNTGSLSDFRERSKSVCMKPSRVDVPEGPHRPRASTVGEEDLKGGYVKDMKVYTFEKLPSNNPDTEAYTVYCHNPARRVSSGTPLSRLNNFVPSAFVNYDSEIKWNDVKTISHYMNRSERRDTLVDIRTPIVLANVGRLTPSDIKQRSFSYSGPSRGCYTAHSRMSGRQRSATVSGASSLRNRQIQLHTQDGQTTRPLTQEMNRGEATVSDHPPTENHTGSRTVNQTNLTKFTTDDTDLESNLKEELADEVHECPNPSNMIESVDNKAPEDQNAHMATSRRNSLALSKTSIRRVSAPGAMGCGNGRVARSSHEARMQRRLSQVKTPCKWVEEEDKSESSESEDFDFKEYDSSEYVERQVSSFMSNLKCSDALEDRVNSYLTSVEKTKSVDGKGTAKTANETEPLPVAKLSGIPEKQKAIDKTSVAPKKTKNVLTQSRLSGLLRRPQMQLQMLLNKVRDAHKAAERADRLKPKVRPKCSF